MKLARVRHLAAEGLQVVFARYHGLRPRDQGGEEPVKLLDVHRLPVLATFEEVPEAVEFGVVEGSLSVKVLIEVSRRSLQLLYDTALVARCLVD